MPRKKEEANRYSVQVRQWRKWSNLQRHVFNETYGIMAHSPDLFLHRKQAPMSRAHWLVTCWNAAWIAADAAAHETPDVIVDLKTDVETKVVRLRAA